MTKNARRQAVPVVCASTRGTFLFPAERVVCECGECSPLPADGNSSNNKNKNRNRKMKPLAWVKHCGLHSTVRFSFLVSRMALHCMAWHDSHMHMHMQAKAKAKALLLLIG